MKSVSKMTCQIVKGLFLWLSNLFKLLRTMFHVIGGGFYRTKVKYKKRPRINLVVNGPSSTNVKDLFGVDSRFTECPSIAVNFFANTPEYEILKPQYYTLADPMFFMDFPGKSVEKVKLFYRILNEKTKWPLTVFIPHSCGKDRFYKYSGITNNFITPVEISSIGYEGFESLRNISYEKGICSPRAFTVAIMALYACIKMGFQQIDVYGLDNNYYASLCLDAEGHPCDIIQHNGEPDEHRVLLDGKGKPFTLHDYLLFLTFHLKNHEYTEKYAEYKGVKIFNHSPITMVDAYPRKLE